jgi:hypothetical protein
MESRIVVGFPSACALKVVPLAVHVTGLVVATPQPGVPIEMLVPDRPAALDDNGRYSPTIPTTKVDARSKFKGYLQVGISILTPESE